MKCMLLESGNGQFYCGQCDPEQTRPLIKTDRRNCQQPPPDLTPLLTRLADLTNHPEIVDQPGIYGRAVLQWAAGIPGQIEEFEVRDDSEVEFILELCRKNVCKKHHDGVCRPSCGPGMIVAVKARMASEICPHRSGRW